MPQRRKDHENAPCPLRLFIYNRNIALTTIIHTLYICHPQIAICTATGGKSGIWNSV